MEIGRQLDDISERFDEWTRTNDVSHLVRRDVVPIRNPEPRKTVERCSTQEEVITLKYIFQMLRN